MQEKKALTGKWRVAKLPDLVDDYLSLTPDPHVLLEVLKDDRISGTYQFGAQSGNLDGWLEKTGSDVLKMVFTFEGQDEMDPVHGFGTATLVDENTLSGEMHYHNSDTYRFVWKRA